MRVTNNCSFFVIVFGFHRDYGAGEDVMIEPGQSADIPGPIVAGENGDESSSILLEGEIACQETPDSITGFCVARGKQASLSSGKTSIVIRHHSDEREF